jgi:ornithine carbamoyltransferase
MAHSLLLGCAMVGMNVKIATPANYLPDADIVEQAKSIANGKTEVIITDDPIEAAKDANVIYTDVWASMGQEEEARTRIPLFQPYQVNAKLMEKTA